MPVVSLQVFAVNPTNDDTVKTNGNSGSGSIFQVIPT
jgi:hypothetical protein